MSLGVTGALCRLEVRYPSREMRHTVKSSRAKACWVWATIAEGSEATTYSSRPTPTIRGLPLRAATSTPGSPSQATTIA